MPASLPPKWKMAAPDPTGTPDFRDKVVLLTGATKGIGLATALAFAEHGARCIITHKWDSASHEALREGFAAVGGAPPLILQADARDDTDTRRVSNEVRSAFGRLDILVSGVAFGQRVDTSTDYTRRDLITTIEYTAWPLLSYTQTILTDFGTPPRYIIGLSSQGPDSYIPNYDLVASAKAVLETECRYLAFRLAGRATVNIVRAGPVRTESLEATVGKEWVDALHAHGRLVDASAVAGTVLAICSGWMDAVTGQVLTVDNGAAFARGAFLDWADRRTQDDP